MEGEVVIEVRLCERRLSLLKAEIRILRKHSGSGETKLLGFGFVCKIAKSLLRSTEGEDAMSG